MRNKKKKSYSFREREIFKIRNIYLFVMKTLFSHIIYSLDYKVEKHLRKKALNDSKSGKF